MNSRRGSALVISVMVVVLLSFMGAALIQIQAARTRRQVTSVDTVRALYVAEAGLSEAFLAVSEGKTGNVGSEAEPASFGDGIYWVEAAENADGQVALVSNALCGVGRFSLALVLQRESNPIAALGFFGEQELSIGSGTVLDGFDARSGSFTEQRNPTLSGTTTGAGARVGSNGEIWIEHEAALVLPATGKKRPAPPLSPPTIVYGDVQPGPEATVVIDPGVVVTGSTAPAIAVADLPQVELPELEPAYSTPTSLLTGCSAHATILVEAGSQLTIAGPATLAVGTLALEPGATLSLDTSGGPITLYCTELLSFAAGSILTHTTAVAADCALLITADDSTDRNGDGLADPAIDFQSQGEYYGLIYAPNAALSIPTGMRIFGSVAAQSLLIQDGGRVTFDQSLAYEGGAIAGLPALISWHVVALPDSPIVDLRLDPKDMLEANGVSTVPSSEAHIEHTVSLEYLDANGVVQTFVGIPRDLDWSSVSKVLGTTWYDKNGQAVDAFHWIRDTLDQRVKSDYSLERLGGVSAQDLWQVNVRSKVR